MDGNQFSMNLPLVCLLSAIPWTEIKRTSMIQKTVTCELGKNREKIMCVNFVQYTVRALHQHDKNSSYYDTNSWAVWKTVNVSKRGFLGRKTMLWTVHMASTVTYFHPFCVKRLFPLLSSIFPLLYVKLNCVYL